MPVSGICRASLVSSRRYSARCTLLFGRDSLHVHTLGFRPMVLNRLQASKFQGRQWPPANMLCAPSRTDDPTAQRGQLHDVFADHDTDQTPPLLPSKAGTSSSLLAALLDEHKYKVGYPPEASPSGVVGRALRLPAVVSNDTHMVGHSRNDHGYRALASTSC